MNATLYLIGVSIGNIKDISPQAIEILSKIQILACEDTRHAARVLKDLGIEGTKKMISFHEHNERMKTPGLLALLNQGQDIGLVVSRGMPGVSDPGYVFIRQAIEVGISVKVIAGPTAFLNALLISGLPMDKFVFLGFPPRKPGKQVHFFERYEDMDMTLIFYESPRRVYKTLKNLESLFADWHIAVCRELTKTHEEIIRGNYTEVLAGLADKDVLGEIVVVLSSKK